MLRNEGDRLTRVVVSTPEKEYFAVSDTEAHNMNELADPETTVRQHKVLQQAMTDAGAKVINAPELEGHPNSVFTRDASLATPQGYIKLRMGLDTRRGEEEWLARVLQTHDEPRAGAIESPGTVEGGDVHAPRKRRARGTFSSHQRKRCAPALGAVAGHGVRSSGDDRSRILAFRRCGERDCTRSASRRTR